MAKKTRSKDYKPFIIAGISFIAVLALILAYYTYEESGAIRTSDLAITNETLNPNFEITAYSNNPIDLLENSKGYREGTFVSIRKINTFTPVIISEWVYRFNSEENARKWYINRISSRPEGFTLSSENTTGINAKCTMFVKESIGRDTSVMSCYRDEIGFEIRMLSNERNSEKLSVVFARDIIKKYEAEIEKRN